MHVAYLLKERLGRFFLARLGEGVVLGKKIRVRYPVFPEIRRNRFSRPCYLYALNYFGKNL